MKRVLITGINGFVGSHLSEFILDNELGEVYGTVRTTNESMRNIHQIMDKINLINCDITDFHSIDRVMEDVSPDYVFHLAAQAFVPSSWKAPVETINTNVIGSLNLFEAVRKNECNPTVQIAGSSEEYGMVYENEVPIKEENPLRPLSPYGVSKVAMDLLGYQYNKSYGLKIIRTRGFNHTGPRRGEAYVCSNWSKQIAEIEVKGNKPEIRVGNLDSKRDFTDVRDMVKGYWTAVEKCTPGEAYNLSSQKTWKMKEVLDMLLGMSKKKIAVKQDPARIRPSDVPILLGDSTKFREKTGWKNEIPFEKTLKDTLNYWRDKVKKRVRNEKDE